MAVQDKTLVKASRERGKRSVGFVMVVVVCFGVWGLVCLSSFLF